MGVGLEREREKGGFGILVHDPIVSERLLVSSVCH